MAKDRWFQLVDDRLEDIPSRIQDLKSGYTERLIFFLILIIAGAMHMILKGDNNTFAIGCFISFAGVAGIMTISITAHTQLCLYRGIVEMRQHMDRIHQEKGNTA